MTLNIIVAADRNMAIGRRGDLAYYIKADLRHFKELTMGNPVIMGRKTFESLPKGALPGRRNIVITRNPAFSAPNVETVGSLADAIALAEGAEKAFIIGGGSVYAEAMPLANRLEITEIDAAADDADTFFPRIDPAVWHEVQASDPLTDEASGLRYRFVSYEQTKL